MFTWHLGNFCAGTSSLWFAWLCICLHDTTTKCHVTPAWVHLGCSLKERISLRYKILQQYHVNAKRPLVTVWNWSAGRLERVAHVWFWQFRMTSSCWSWDNEKTCEHVTAIQNQEVISAWNSHWCEFSHINTPLVPHDIHVMAMIIRLSWKEMTVISVD